MQRERALCQDFVQPAEPIGLGGYLQDGPGIQPEADEPGDQRQKDRLVLFVEGNVDEDVGGDEAGSLRHVALLIARLSWRPGSNC